MKKRWLSLVAAGLLLWPLSLAHARGGGPAGPMAGPKMGPETGTMTRSGQCSRMQERQHLRLRDGSCQRERTREAEQTRERDQTSDQEQTGEQDQARDGGDL